MSSILIIEDDYYVRNMYARSFTLAGYKVELAGDAKEAFEKLQNIRFDAIILDIMLPEVDGIQILRKLREPAAATRNTPVFIVTNRGEDALLKEAFSIGADGYFYKQQFEPNAIVTELTAFLSKQDGLPSSQSPVPAGKSQAPVNPQSVPVQPSASNQSVPPATTTTASASSTVPPAPPTNRPSVN